MTARRLLITFLLLICTVFQIPAMAVEDDASKVNLEINLGYGSASACYTLSRADRGRDLNLYFAYYDENEDFITSTVYEESYDDEEYSSNIPENAKLVKAMVWEIGTNMPICMAEEEIPENFSAEFGILTYFNVEKPEVEILTKDGQYKKFTLSDDAEINGEEDFFYTDVVMYSKDNEGKITSLYIGSDEIDKTKKNISKHLGHTQLMDSNLSYSDTEITRIEYYETEESSNEISFRVDPYALCFVNKNAELVSDFSSFVSKWYNGKLDEVIITDNDLNGEIDFIYAVEHTSGMVTEILSSSVKYVNASEEEIELSLENTDGIKKGDVINIFPSVYGEENICDIIVGSNEFSGLIYEYDAAYTKCTLENGEEFYADYNDVMVGQEGLYLTDIYKNFIMFFENTDLYEKGMLYKIYENTNGADSYKVAYVLGSDGLFKEYTFASTVEINGESVYSQDIEPYNSAKCELALLKLNRNGEIEYLYTNENTEAIPSFISYEEKNSYQFNLTDKAFGNYKITDSSVVLSVCDDEYITVSPKYNYGICDINALVNGENYNVELIVNYKNEIISAMVFGVEPYDERKENFGLLYTVYNDVIEADDVKTAYILNKDGKFTDYPFARNVIINGQNTTNENIEIYSSPSPELISYTLDRHGEIVALYKGADNGEYNLSVKQNLVYNKDDKTIGIYRITDTSSILAVDDTGYVTSNIKYNYGMADLNAFENGSTLSAEILYNSQNEIVSAIIFGVEPYDEREENFGLIYTIYNDAVGADDVKTAYIFNKDGKFTDYQFARNVIINGQNTANENIEIYTSPSPELISYTLDRHGEIVALYKGDENGKYTVNSKSDMAYNSEENIFGSYKITDNSVMLGCKETDYVTSGELKEYIMLPDDLLENGKTYSVATITNADNEILVAMVFSAEYSVEADSLAYYVTGVSAREDENGEEVLRVKCVKDFEDYTFIVPFDVAGDNPEELLAGSVIQIKGEEKAKALKILLTAADIEDIVYFNEVVETGVEAEGYYTYADTVEMATSNKICYSSGKEISFNNNMNAMFVKMRYGSVCRVYADEYTVMDIESEDYLYDTPDDYLVIFKYDNKPLGAVIIDVNGDSL